MTQRHPVRWAWVGACLGLLLALVLFAPARWLGSALFQLSGGQIQLANERGTVWEGHADLLLTGGEGSRSVSALPQGVGWRLGPRWREGGPALAASLSLACCATQPLDLWVRPGLNGARVQIGSHESQWPAVLLAGLGTPWNTLRPEGQLQLRTDGLRIDSLDGRMRLQGQLDVDALDMSSRVSTLKPLGSYRVALQSTSDGQGLTLDLSTLDGSLELSGQGQWVNGRLRFSGFAQAQAGREAALENLLNIIGRRQGPRSLLQFG